MVGGLLASGLASFSWTGVGSKSWALAGTALPVALVASADGPRAISPVADREGFKIGGLSGGPDGAPAAGAAVARAASSPVGRCGVDRDGGRGVCAVARGRRGTDGGAVGRDLHGDAVARAAQGTADEHRGWVSRQSKSPSRRPRRRGRRPLTRRDLPRLQGRMRGRGTQPPRPRRAAGHRGRTACHDGGEGRGLCGKGGSRGGTPGRGGQCGNDAQRSANRDAGGARRGGRGPGPPA